MGLILLGLSGQAVVLLQEILQMNFLEDLAED
jgi:hypothetical protein